jgi:hypothetical protein
MDRYWSDTVSTSLFQADAKPETIDRLRSALKSERCRLVVSYFEDTGASTVSIDDLARCLGSQKETDRSETGRSRVYLHHADLPRLESAGLVDYDTRTETVRYLEPPAVVDRDVWARLLIPSEEAT